MISPEALDIKNREFGVISHPLTAMCRTIQRWNERATDRDSEGRWSQGSECRRSRRAKDQSFGGAKDRGLGGSSRTRELQISPEIYKYRDRGFGED